MTRTSYQTHARVQRKIVNLNNGGEKMICLFADCERHAFLMYCIPRAEHRHPRDGRSCDYWQMVNGPEAHVDYPFCSERHRTMFVESTGWRLQRLMDDRGHGYGYLPTGSRGMM